MERLPIPTAPSERHKWIQPQPRRSGWLILTLLLSLGAGFAGALVARVYQFEWLQLDTPDIVVVPSTAGSAAAQVVENLQDRQSEAVVELLADTVWLGPGVVLSNDGWIVATAAVLGDHTAVTIRTVQGKIYSADAIERDDQTGLVFIHVPSTGLRIAEFRDTAVALGESVVAYSRVERNDTIAFANIGGSDELDRVLPQHRGAPLYDFNLSVVGFVTDTEMIIPIQVVNEVAYDIFTTGTIDR